MAINPAISLRNLSYAYPDGNIAIDDVSLDIPAGKITVLLGPNGAGKSTLLMHMNRTLSGKGNVLLFGKDLSEKKRRKIIEEVGIVFQDPDDQLFMPTILDDVSFGPLNLGFSAAESEERARKALVMVSLEDYGNRSPEKLSLGEKKRAALATVLSMDPQVFLLDEPTANLDPKNRSRLISLMKKLRKNGKTLVIATHDVDFVGDVADFVYVINRRVMASGTPREIFGNPGLLEKTNLQVPAITRLFEILSDFGYDYTELPLSMDDAAHYFSKLIMDKKQHFHVYHHSHNGGSQKHEHA